MKIANGTTQTPDPHTIRRSKTLRPRRRLCRCAQYHGVQRDDCRNRPKARRSETRRWLDGRALPFPARGGAEAAGDGDG